MISPTILKLALVLAIFGILYFLDKKAKGAVLAVLIYLIIPTPDDIIIAPAIISILASLISAPFLVAGAVYYLGLLLAIIIVSLSG